MTENGLFGSGKTDEPKVQKALDNAVIGMGLLYGAVEQVRDNLLRDDPLKWKTSISGLEAALAQADKLRAGLF